MAVKKKSGRTADRYQVVAGLDTTDNQRIEAGEIIAADQLTAEDLAAYLEIGAIVEYEEENPQAK